MRFPKIARSRIVKDRRPRLIECLEPEVRCAISKPLANPSVHERVHSGNAGNRTVCLRRTLLACPAIVAALTRPTGL